MVQRLHDGFGTFALIDFASSLRASVDKRYGLKSLEMNCAGMKNGSSLTGRE